MISFKPVAIGGLGGSGTRQIMSNLGGKRLIAVLVCTSAVHADYR